MFKFVTGIGIFIIACLFWHCSEQISDYTEVNRAPQIEPDYSGITFPPNIAPLNFIVQEESEKYMVKIHTPKGRSIQIKSAKGEICIPAKRWKKLLKQSIGEDITIDVWAKQKGQWEKFLPIINHIARDSIDSHLVYRIIDPGFEMWGEMEIAQRCLENFEKKPIMVNRLSKKNCINCHSFANKDSHSMLFHMRGKLAGTIIYNNGELKKVNTKTDRTISPGVYPAWHPNARYVAYSVNHIIQQFHSVSDKKVEVLDTLSDLILYDVEKNCVTTSPIIASKNSLETFPNWSPDGKYLYYCSAKNDGKLKFDQIHYDLLRIGFDPETATFGKVDTLFKASEKGMSVSFPRVSPGGKYLMFCLSEYGNFTIWHKESDLYLMNLESKEISRPKINSDEAESYHSWSSNGKWIVFSSRRKDGLFTRSYFAWFNNGETGKPFVLPHQDPGFYTTFLKSYNIPEFVKSEVNLEPRIVSIIANKESDNATFKEIF